MAAPCASGETPSLKYREKYQHTFVRCRNRDHSPDVCDVATSGRWRATARFDLLPGEAAGFDEATSVSVRVGDRAFSYALGDDPKLRLSRGRARLARDERKTLLTVRWNERRARVRLRQRHGFLGKGRLHPPARRLELETTAHVVLGDQSASFYLPVSGRRTARWALFTTSRRLRTFHIRLNGWGERIDE